MPCTLYITVQNTIRSCRQRISRLKSALHLLPAACSPVQLLAPTFCYLGGIDRMLPKCKVFPNLPLSANFKSFFFFSEEHWNTAMSASRLLSCWRYDSFGLLKALHTVTLTMQQVWDITFISVRVCSTLRINSSFKSVIWCSLMGKIVYDDREFQRVYHQTSLPKTSLLHLQQKINWKSAAAPRLCRALCYRIWMHIASIYPSSRLFLQKNKLIYLGLNVLCLGVFEYFFI